MSDYILEQRFHQIEDRNKWRKRARREKDQTAVMSKLQFFACALIKISLKIETNF